MFNIDASAKIVPTAEIAGITKLSVKQNKLCMSLTFCGHILKVHNGAPIAKEYQIPYNQVS
jgi:hypothetical protein